MDELVGGKSVAETPASWAFQYAAEAAWSALEMLRIKILNGAGVYPEKFPLE
jgi:hypothetical protein